MEKSINIAAISYVIIRMKIRKNLEAKVVPMPVFTLAYIRNQWAHPSQYFERDQNWIQKVERTAT